MATIRSSVLHSVIDKATHAKSHELGIFALVSAAFLYVLATIKQRGKRSIVAPVAGAGDTWQPEWMLRLRYSFICKDVLHSGYNQFKDRIFKIVRNDGDIFVLPHRYLKQIGNLTSDHSSSSKGQTRNMANQYSTCEIILGSDVHFRMIQQVLTKNINATIPMMKEEVDLAIEKEIPAATKDQWVELSIFDLLARITARVTMRVFVGLDACRDEDWLQASIDYDINVGTTVIFLRMFPPFLHRFIAPLLPAWWRAHANIRTAERIIGPIIRQRAEAKAAAGDDYEAPIDLMQWIWENAEGKDAEPNAMALRMLVVGLAALHTTSMATSHAMYDLIAHPEYFEPLREEMLQVLREDGGWDKHTLNKLKKLDSFVKETQRFSPASLMSFNRYLFKPFTLDDGTYLPAGTHIAMASEPILQDPLYCPSPSTFDGFRFLRKRLDTASDPDNMNKHQLASIDSTNMHFGAGRYACPGRFFASAAIKIMMCHILLKYDFKYPEGKGRPRNVYADENVFPDMEARVLMREREQAEADVDVILGVAGDLEHWDLRAA